MKILYAILAAIAVYLLGAFYSAGFDISLWGEGVRFVVAMMGAAAAVCILLGMSHP